MLDGLIDYINERISVHKVNLSQVSGSASSSRYRGIILELEDIKEKITEWIEQNGS